MATGSVVEMQKSERKEGVRLEVVRVIKAKRERVFDAWTRTETIRQWFGPGGKTVRAVEADARVGGEYMIAMGGVCENGPDSRDAAGIDMRRDSSVKGRYVKVDPYDLLQFTWVGDWQPDEESLVTIELRDVEGGTEMRLIQEGFLTEVSCSNHSLGWNGSFDKLTRLLES
jgi:uncharacterized protein YndB with AHSA1/START domain